MKDSTSLYPSASDVLVAGPGLSDQNFARSLVYLYEHSEHGSLGLILNRPLGRSLSELLPNASFPEDLGGTPMHFGGPVQTDQFLLSLFRVDPVTHRFVCELNPDVEDIRAARSDPHCRLRAFVGYAGWGEGQLAAELGRRDWSWTTPDEVMLADTPTPALWELMVEGDFRWQAVRECFPDHPERN